jgi:hypothetical protein
MSGLGCDSIGWDSRHQPRLKGREGHIGTPADPLLDQGFLLESIPKQTGFVI